MEIICEKCHKKFETGIRSFKSNIRVEGDSRLNAPCPHCSHVNQISNVKIQFNSSGELESITPLDNQAYSLRFFDKK